MTKLRTLRLLPSFALAACGGGTDAAPAAAAGESGGTIVIATPGEPDNLLPAITSTQSGRQVEDLVFQHLADIGTGLNTVGDGGFTPNLARSWEWAADSMSIAFRLDPDARWHDGVAVRAADVAFTFALYVDPATASPAAPELANVDSVSVRDSLTAVVWFKSRKPEQFFSIAHQIHVLPRHLLDTLDRRRLASSAFATQPVGSGPFRVVRWQIGQRLELAADTTGGRRRARLDRVVYSMAPDPVTAFTRVATGEADVFEAVRPDKVVVVAGNAQLRLVMMPSLDYSYLGFNLVQRGTDRPHRIFGDRIVRRALTLATDRRAIVANIYDTLAVQARGPFTAAQASNDPSLKALPYSADSANVLLDAAGWTRGADSIRRRSGTPLSFGIIVTSTSVARMRAAVLLQEQFRRVGADVRIEATDMPGFLSRMKSGAFDAVLGAWTPDPGPGSVRNEWSSSASKGGNNYGAYRSVAFDAQVDSGLATFAPAEMRAHFATAWRIIGDDAPAIWLAEPRRVMAVHKRIVTTGMRTDAWWAGIAQWHIPADQRIARDLPQPAGAAR